MQLKKRSIAAPLAAATAALLGQSPPKIVEAQELTPWKFDTAVLYYAETGGRVKDQSFDVYARKEVGDQHFIDLTVTHDALTGASPSGAVPSGEIHTYTTPSGRIQSVAAGDLPLDSSFHDKRNALGANYEWPVTRLTLFNVGLSWSDEYDYTHKGVNFKLARDIDNRNTTVSFGFAKANDTVNPVGGTPVPLSIVTGNETDRLGDQTKDVNDVLVGVSQVVNRHTVVQVNYGLSKSTGYLNDPYKVLSVVDPFLGVPVAPPEGVDQQHLNFYENRPDSRQEQTLYTLLKHDVEGDAFDISYRYMTDDWDVRSHTIDIHYRFNARSGSYVQPHIRYYRQSAASFYGTTLVDGQPLPQYATADYRLSDFHAETLGLEFGAPMRNGEMSGRIEVYRQAGSPSPGSRIGMLRYFDLNPGFTALIAQLSYKFGG